MKRQICLILVMCLFLSGCSVLGERIKDPVTFYYVRSDFDRDMGDVIVSEIREASGHRGDLPYLLALYSMGPSKEGIVSPLPRNTQIIPTEHTEKGIVLSLSDSALKLSDADFTLAGACLSLTCMELTGAQQVTVVCEDRSITINAENLVMDGSLVQVQTED